MHEGDLPIDHGMALSDPQGVVGFGRLIYPHSSALRASNEGYDKSDLLAEVLIYRHSDEYNVEATSHTTSNLVIFATKKGIYEEAKIDHGSGTLVAFCIATTHGGGGAATGDDLQYTL